MLCMPIPNDHRVPLLFALDGCRDYGELVAGGLGLSLSNHVETRFADGERKLQPLTDVRGREVFIISALHSEPGNSPHDKLCNMLFFIGALKDAAAASVTAVIPYLCYARADRRDCRRIR
jgi:ribose-phosphate pyrophosphokinase